MDLISFLLGKLTETLASPVFFTWLLILFGLVAQWRGRHRLAIGLNTAAVAFLWLVSTCFFSGLLVRNLEMRHVPASDLPTADAIVVLAGVTGKPFPPQPVVHMGIGSDRLLYAATLYHQGKAPLVFFSGNGDESAEMAEVMGMMGVPKTAMVLGDTSLQNTYGAARDLKSALQSHHVGRVLLVTSAIRMPRAIAVFTHMGYEVIPAPTDFLTRSRFGLQANLGIFLPNINSLDESSLAFHELIGMLCYKLASWI